MEQSEGTINGPRDNRLRRVLTKDIQPDLSAKALETSARRSLWALLLGLFAFAASILSDIYLPQVVFPDRGDVGYATPGAITCLSFILGGFACLIAGGFALTAVSAVNRSSVRG